MELVGCFIDNDVEIIIVHYVSVPYTGPFTGFQRFNIRC